jgi:hypothetical protein
MILMQNEEKEMSFWFKKLYVDVLFIVIAS